MRIIYLEWPIETFRDYLSIFGDATLPRRREPETADIPGGIFVEVIEHFCHRNNSSCGRLPRRQEPEVI